MSEKTAIENLCRMLDERGIEWWHDDEVSENHVDWMTDDAVFTSLGMDGNMLAVKVISKMTPEQAIAATVGRCDVSALRAKVNAQSDYIGKLRGEYKALDEQMECRCSEYRTTIRKLKTELDAATVGAGTCHMEVKDNLAETEGMGEVWLECDKCHWQMPLEPTTPRFKHCPNCGKRIEVSE